MQQGIGYEIDFLPVGSGDKSGDAIAIRYGTPNNYKVMVVDGGTKESGKALVDHIRKYYGTEHVDYLVNTHPDADHASGLEIVLEELTVGELWLHCPWVYTDKLKHYFQDQRITSNSLKDRFAESFRHAFKLYEMAVEKRVPIHEPFVGAQIGAFKVLSPTSNFYKKIIPHFNRTPEANRLTAGFDSSMESLNEGLAYESWYDETLSEESETSFDNESSVILYSAIANRGLLLTGDAGELALMQAQINAKRLNIDLTQCKFIQVPHHGSRHNVTPKILDAIVGPIIDESDKPTKTAFVSASKESTKHPRKVVTNAFTRRGAKVCVTKGKTIRHSYNMPDRNGWVASQAIPFHHRVEA